jgi:hypothetical protein
MGDVLKQCAKNDQVQNNPTIWHDWTWLEGIGKLFLKTKI